MISDCYLCYCSSTARLGNLAYALVVGYQVQRLKSGVRNSILDV